MHDAVCQFLLEKANSYLDEMLVSLHSANAKIESTLIEIDRMRAERDLRAGKIEPR